MNEKRPNTERQSMQSLMKQIDAILKSETSKYYEAEAAQMRSLRQLVQEVVATRISPVLKAELDDFPQGDFKEKQSLARWLGTELRSLGMSIVCPRTGKPARLHASAVSVSPKTMVDKGKFQVLLHGCEGTGKCTFTSTSVPTIDLMPSPERRESAVERWAVRVKEEKKPSIHRE